MRRPTPAAEFVEIERETAGLSRTAVSFFLSFRAAVLRFELPSMRFSGFPVVQY
jgi:hypothetical protein